MSLFDFPITPSEKTIADFKELMRTEYNANYTDEEASEGAYNLLNIFRVLIKIDRDLFIGRKRLIKVLKKMSLSSDI